MSEPRKWVGYADLLEAKRKREEREAEPAPADTQSEAVVATQTPTDEAEQSLTASGNSEEPAAQLYDSQANAVVTPVVTPVTTGVTTPANPSSLISISDTPAAKSVSAPHSTPVESSEENTNQAQYLDATHTGSEQRIYSVMYRETVSKGVRERHFGPSELIRKTGIRSDRTIRTAIRGLIQKLSLEIVSNVTGSPLGPRYRVFDPKEIIRRRRVGGIKIDQQSKKIIEDEPATGVATGVATPVATGDKNYRGTGAEITGVTPVDFTGVYKYINNYSQSEGDTASSSSKSITENPDDDNALLDSLRDIYERATGNSWTTADAITAQRGRDILPDVWGIAICYCVDRAPGHKFDRLAYVLEEALRHDEEMRHFAKEDLGLIMRHSLRQIERARQSGKWEPAGVVEEGSVAQVEDKHR